MVINLKLCISKKVSKQTTLIKILVANIFIQVQLRKPDRWTEKRICRKDINMDLMKIWSDGVG
jgi:hypothetical protein